MKNNPQDKKASDNRIKKLEKSVFKAVQTCLKKEDGDFTVAEIVSVMTKVGHNYNQRALDFQWADAAGILPQSEPTKDESKDVIPIGQAGKA